MLATVSGAVPVATVEISWVPDTVPVQAKLPLAFVTVQPVLPEPPPRRMSPVDIPPIDTVFVVFASIVSAPVPDIAVPDTFKLLTAVALNVPPDTVPPLNVPAEIVAPLIVDVQANAPVLFVTVHPVEAEPPPRRMSPVLVPPIWTWPVVPALIDILVAAVEAEMFGLTPENVRAVLVKVFVFMVPLAVRAPVTLVASCSSMVPALFRTMLPVVVVVRFRLLLVLLRAVVPMFTAERLLKLVLAPPAPQVVQPRTPAPVVSERQLPLEPSAVGRVRL